MYARLSCPIEKSATGGSSDEEDLIMDVVCRFDNSHDLECQQSMMYDCAQPIISEYISDKKPGYYLCDQPDTMDVMETCDDEYCDLRKITVPRFKTAYALERLKKVIERGFRGLGSAKTTKVMETTEISFDFIPFAHALLEWSLLDVKKPPQNVYEEVKKSLDNKKYQEQEHEFWSLLFSNVIGDVDLDLFVDVFLDELKSAVQKYNKKIKA